LQLILVRHGETVHNVAGIAQGWNDSALSERGEQQVAALASKLATMDNAAMNVFIRRGERWVLKLWNERNDER